MIEELLTDRELRVLDLLGAATAEFAELPEHHPTDLREWAHEIHHLQHRVMARAAVRSYPEMCTPLVRRTS